MFAEVINHIQMGTTFWTIREWQESIFPHIILYRVPENKHVLFSNVNSVIILQQKSINHKEIETVKIPL